MVQYPVIEWFYAWVIYTSRIIQYYFTYQQTVYVSLLHNFCVVCSRLVLEGCNCLDNSYWYIDYQVA